MMDIFYVKLYRALKKDEHEQQTLDRIHRGQHGAPIQLASQQHQMNMDSRQDNLKYTSLLFTSSRHTRIVEEANIYLSQNLLFHIAGNV